MRHYEVGEWTDFVRNLISEEQRNEMERHQLSCSQCASRLEFLRQVATTLQAEQAYDSASAALAASARQVFVGAEVRHSARDRAIQALQTLVAHLAYDSAADLRPAGARSHRPSSRQMLYQAGNYCLDLRFDRELDSTRITLVGQVANREAPGSLKTGLPVAVLWNASVIAQTASNEFGEFSLEYTPRPDLRLCVSIADSGVRVEVPLKRLSDEHEN